MKDCLRLTLREPFAPAQISNASPLTEFTCSPSGRCIEKGQFCDGVNDCEDDEPVGCSTLSPGPKVMI